MIAVIAHKRIRKNANKRKLIIQWIGLSNFRCSVSIAFILLHGVLFYSLCWRRCRCMCARERERKRLAHPVHRNNAMMRCCCRRFVSIHFDALFIYVVLGSFIRLLFLSLWLIWLFSFRSCFFLVNFLFSTHPIVYIWFGSINEHKRRERQTWPMRSHFAPEYVGVLVCARLFVHVYSQELCASLACFNQTKKPKKNTFAHDR